MQAIAAIAQAVNGGNANIPGMGGIGAVAGMGGPQASPEAPFAGLLAGAVHSMNRLNAQAASLTTGLVEGSGVGVSQAMIATEKADQAFELALAVRNKAVAAYQQVMNLQF